jgi:uncharacterized protein (DUF2062 family)
MVKGMVNKIKSFFKWIYLELVKLDDTPQKIALGFGLGVFFGVMPAMGPLVALFFAFAFKANRAAAVLGCVITNAWTSIPVFLVSVKIGSALTGTNYATIRSAWGAVMRSFNWQALLQLSLYEIAIPVLLGYLAVSLFFGLTAYAIALAAVKVIKIRRQLMK